MLYAARLWWWQTPEALSLILMVLYSITGSTICSRDIYNVMMMVDGS